MGSVGKIRWLYGCGDIYFGWMGTDLDFILCCLIRSRMRVGFEFLGYIVNLKFILLLWGIVWNGL